MKAFENLIEPLKLHSGLKKDALQKRGEEDIQKVTDKYIEEVNEIGAQKEKEVMEV